MPINDNELLWKLIDASEKKRVKWEKTATTDQFAAAFGGKWTVVIDKGINAVGDIHYWLSINNAEGEEILKIRDDERLERLFELARRHALKVNDALEDLMKELDDESSS